MDAHNRSFLITSEFADPQTGILGRDVPSGKIFHPGGPIQLKGDRLLWSFDHDKHHHKAPSKGLLDDFIALWKGDGVAILAFAQKWGPLRVGEDGIFQPGAPRGEEPLDLWRFYSHRAYAVLVIAAGLKAGEPVSESDWAQLSDQDASGKERGEAKFFGMPKHARREPVFRPEGISWSGRPIDPFRIIAGEVTEWMTRFAVGFRVVWDGRKWKTEIAYGNSSILSAIAFQLALKAAQVDTVYICSGCGFPYIRVKRRPNARQGNFCHKCGRDEATRQADRRRQQKAADARRLHAEGLPLSEIAARLHVRKPSTVRNLLKRR